MSEVAFTGERLHAGSELFAVDLARHEAAYEIALERASGARVLDLGCGSGYGAARLTAAGACVVAVDRVPPDPGSRRSGVHFVRGRIEGIPLAPQRFDLVVSFQVVEHLEDPSEYLTTISALLRPGGTALLTTPNRLTSDGVNPYHVHEYEAEELARRLRGFFDDVEVRGIGASEPVRRYMQARSRRIRRIMRLDPLGLRDRLPRGLVEWLFARFALLVRQRTRSAEGTPDVSWRDFPVGPPDDDCIDLLAICRQPRAG